MGGFISLNKLRLSRRTGVIEGLDYEEFNPKRTTIGVIKASGGIVYINVKGVRIKPTTEALKELEGHAEHLGPLKLLVTDCVDLFEGAVPTQQLPWKGYLLQEYTLANGTHGYHVIPKEFEDAQP